ncbi:MAG: nuclear transport factor 2 family protein [Alphaproteobacteria bacterium]|nr:nuclear transport factor 2 family protein [Alphaproteobacteria bacterium]
MTDAEALLTKLFAAYNRRDFATFSAGLHDGVDWPDQLRGGRLKGRAALEAYWGVIDQAIQVEVTPIAFALEQDGRIRVELIQVVRGLTGSLWTDIQVRQYYTLRDGLVWRMDVARPEDMSPTP